MSEQNNKVWKSALKVVGIVLITVVVICGILVFIGIRDAVNYRSSTTYTQPVSQQTIQTQETNDMTWHTVFSLSNSNKFYNTSAFAMKGSQWRISWRCRLTDQSIGGEGGFAGSIDSVVDNTGHTFALDDGCKLATTTTTNYYGEKPGQYYLKFGPSYSIYSVMVEDYY